MQQMGRTMSKPDMGPTYISPKPQINRKGITPYTSFCYQSVNVNIHSLHTNPNTFLPRHGTCAFPTFSKIMQTFSNQINLISNPYPPDPNLPFEQYRTISCQDAGH